jgi:hypothetical protein
MLQERCIAIIIQKIIANHRIHKSKISIKFVAFVYENDFWINRASKQFETHDDGISGSDEMDSSAIQLDHA